MDPLKSGYSVKKLGHEGSKLLNGLVFFGSGSWVWTHAGPVGISLLSELLRRLRQEDPKFKACLGYRVSSKLACIT